MSCSLTISSSGLSPRLRGNHRGIGVGQGRRGSIPAPAGEPHLSYRGLGCTWVYPRACGGTPWAPSGFDEMHGLSPRLRGNLAIGRWCQAFKRSIPAPAGELHEVGPFHGVDRSIPAPAGEPEPGAFGDVSKLVYPRACGGTAAASSNDGPSMGLSPRLRGNPPWRWP